MTALPARTKARALPTAERNMTANTGGWQVAHHDTHHGPIARRAGRGERGGTNPSCRASAVVSTKVLPSSGASRMPDPSACARNSAPTKSSASNFACEEARAQASDVARARYLRVRVGRGRPRIFTNNPADMRGTGISPEKTRTDPITVDQVFMHQRSPLGPRPYRVNTGIV